MKGVPPAVGRGGAGTIDPGPGPARPAAGTPGAPPQAGRYARPTHHRQGAPIACPEEIAPRTGHTGAETRHRLGTEPGTSAHGQYVISGAERFANSKERPSCP